MRLKTRSMASLKQIQGVVSPKKLRLGKGFTMRGKRERLHRTKPQPHKSEDLIFSRENSRDISYKMQ